MLSLEAMSFSLTNVANTPSTLELSEDLKQFCVGLVIQVTVAINALLDAKIDKLNQGLEECNRNYNDMRIKLKAIANGNRSPDNSESPHQ
jgi:hypothetical protein